MTTFVNLLDPQGVITQGKAINDLGQIVGYYLNNSGGIDAFLLSGTAYTTLDDPNALGFTYAYGINATGQISGYYVGANATTRGFIYSNGTYTTLVDLSGDGYTVGQGINDAGQVVGYYEVPGGAGDLGFLYSGGSYTTLNAPGSNGADTFAEGINNLGQIVGYYDDIDGGTHGFLFSNGAYSTIDDPLGVNGTEAFGINDAGQIVGSYFDSADVQHGFMYSNGVYTTIDDPAGSGGTTLADINNNGQIVGEFDGAGFLANPQTVSWATGVSGSFTGAANWNTDTVPGSTDHALITVSGTYTVTCSTSETINSLATGSGATLAVTGGTFSITGGTGSGANAGTIVVDAGATLVLGGGVTNNGAIQTTGGIINVYGQITGSGSFTIGSGGVGHVFFGGTASGMTISSGGSQIVDSGGSATDLAMNGSATINGGTLELLNGASGGGSIAFTGTGGTLKIDGPGHDNVSGGAGPNTVDYTNLATPGLVAIIQGGGGTVSKGGANGSDTLAGVQKLIDNGTGRSNGDVFEVDSAETVTANSSNFNYLIELSAGVNLAYGTNLTGISEFVSNVGTNTVSFAADPNFAYLFGSTGNDTLTLGSGGGYLFGEGGTNILDGGANATNLFVGGDGGSDTMNGGTGTASNFYFVDSNDQVNGAGAFNTMIELVSGVTVQLGSAQYQDVQEFVANSGTNAVTVANTDSDFSYLYGGAGNDTLTTGSGGGYLFGEGGTNVLTGGGGLNVFVADGASGVDTMNGGSGSNIYYIDNNSIVHGAGTFNNVIELQQNVSLTLGSAQLGTDVQQVILNGGTNTVDFSSATSSVFLYGGSGNDTLFGGTGNDFLYGGTGTNTFGFKPGWGQDTIEDWTAGTNDQIDLTALATQGVHAIADLTQTITAGHDVITSSHTGSNSITLLGVGTALTASSFHFA